jgi:hypothetical protein
MLLLKNSVMKSLYKKTNASYELNLDPHLTYEKFMKYCKENNLNPIKTVNTLKDK